jgi:hypothetical protein
VQAKKLIEYNQHLYTYEQLGEMAKTPCNSESMLRRIRRHGIEKAVEGVFHGRGKTVYKNYKGNLYTYEQLGEMASDPCSAGSMCSRIRRHGIEKAVEGVFHGRGKTVYKNYKGNLYTYEQLGEMASDPCSAGSMRYRIKRHGVEKAVEGFFTTGKTFYENHNGKLYTYKQLGKMAKYPCSPYEMKIRTAALGVEVALSKDFSCVDLAFIKKIDDLTSKDPNRSLLSPREVYALGESQGWKCALSGVPMTANKKKSPTNISIDRIEAGGPYTIDNIRLVCCALNSWRGDTPTAEFVRFCTLVSEHHKKGLIKELCQESTETTERVSLTRSTTTMHPRSKRTTAWRGTKRGEKQLQTVV